MKRHRAEVTFTGTDIFIVLQKFKGSIMQGHSQEANLTFDHPMRAFKLSNQHELYFKGPLLLLRCTSSRKGKLARGFPLAETTLLCRINESIRI